MLATFPSFDVDAALALLVDTTIKGTFVLLAAALVVSALRKSTASVRHLVWLLSLSVLLALPALPLVVPAIGLPWQSTAIAPRAIEPLLASSDLASAPVTGARRILVLPWVSIVFAVWAGGALVLLARLGIGMMAASRIAQRAHASADPEWTRIFGAMAGTLPVALRCTDDSSMPMTIGPFHPVILVPRESERWGADERRLVLLHELAHVRRRDCLTQIPAQIACALLWHNPAVWLAARRLYLERERACDDAVLRAGERASDYAQALLEMARGLSPRRHDLASASLARSLFIEGRLRAILDPSLSRRSAGRVGRAAIAAGIACAAVTLAALRPAPAPTSVASAPAVAEPAAAAEPAPAPGAAIEGSVSSAVPVREASAQISGAPATVAEHAAAASVPECQSRVEIMRLEAAASKHFLNRDWVRATEAYEALVECNPSDAHLWFDLGFTNRALGSYDRSIQAYQRALDLGHRPAVAMYNMACAYSMKNDTEAAFEWLRKSLVAGFSFKELLTNDRDLENLRADPRFEGLVEAYLA
jgi:beta-lactamase regulating signal transducer with metallopeptidase domain